MFRQASSREWRIIVASALQQMGIACWEYRLETGELWWSDTAGPMHGLPAGFQPRDFDEAMSLVASDDSRPRDVEEMIAALRSGPVQTERLALLPDGSTRWISHHYFLMVGEAGNADRIAGMMVDIEERKRRESQNAALLHASQVLAESLDVTETLGSIARLLVPGLADWCVVEVVDDGALRPVVTAHVDPEKVRWAEKVQDEYQLDMEAPFGAPKVVRTGSPEFYPEITDEMMVAAADGDEQLLSILREIGYRSVMVLPIRTGDEIMGTATLGMAESHRSFDEQAFDFAERLMALVAAALDNARLHARLTEAWNSERVAVESLQRGLTPEPLPDLDYVALAAHYEIGGRDKVGGDWYDAFETESGEIALVIGDIVGRGVDAVAAMSEHRNALRVLVMEGHSPGEAMTLLNRLVTLRQEEGRAFATAVCMTYSPDTHRLVWSSAGHPPAMVRLGDGRVERLWDQSDSALGAGLDEYGEGEVVIEPGALLLLYTDGLIERRDESIDVSVDRLSEELAKAPNDPDMIVKQLVARLPSSSREDDVAVLVARF